MKIPLSRFCLLTALLFGPLGLHAQKVDPKPVTTPSPGYPESLIDTGFSGMAEVDLVVKADGSVANPELAMASHRAFGRAAMAAVVAWKFEPGSQDGTPVDRKVSIPFRFQAPLEQQINASVKRRVFGTLAEPALTLKEYGAKLKVKKEARPVYPRSLLGSNVDEKVEVKFVVAPDGTTLNPSVVGAKHKEFEPAAMMAVALMTYEPTKKDGKGVYVEATTNLNFADDGAARGGRGGGRGGGGGDPDEE